MNENILDQIEDKSNESFYSKSKKNLKLASLLVIGSLMLTMIAVKTGFLVEIISSIGAILLLVAVVISFAGILNGIKSYIKKEKHFANRFLIILGNFIIFGTFILMIIANILDLMRFLNG